MIKTIPRKQTKTFVKTFAGLGLTSPAECLFFPLYQVFLLGLFHLWRHMSRLTTKPTKWLCAQQRFWLNWTEQSDQSSLCAQWVSKDPSFLHADSEDRSDWVDAQADLSLCWAYSHFVGFDMMRLIWLLWCVVISRQYMSVLYGCSLSLDQLNHHNHISS